MHSDRCRLAVLPLSLSVLAGAAQVSSARAEPLMTCQLSSDTAMPGGSTTIEMFLQHAEVRGYETALVIARTAGTGTASVPCPGGVVVDEARTDWLFFGQGSVFGIALCTDLRMAQALLSGTVSVGATPAYLATYTVDVSVDATPGSTFEISILPTSNLSDGVGNPLPFSRGAPCVVTIAPAIPAASGWGIVITALIFITTGTLVIYKKSFGLSGDYG